MLVHGYNNEELDVLKSYSTIQEQMQLLGFLGGANASYDAVVGFAWPGPGAIIVSSKNVRVINCKEVVQSHGGYRAAGQVWAYMSQELANPSGTQFVTLPKTSEALTAVFGDRWDHIPSGVAPGQEAGVAAVPSAHF